MRHDEAFKAMADPNRRQILTALCHEPHEAGELARLVGLAPNALSFHLRALKSADLVTVQRHGRALRYSVDRSGLSDWLQHVGSLFPSAPPAFGVNSADNGHRQVTQSPRDASTAIADDSPIIARYESDTSQDQLPTELL